MNKGIVLLFIITFITGCGEDKGIVNVGTFLKESNSKVLFFMKEMNPELHKTMDKIAVEIIRADKKIQQLHELNKIFPTQGDIIDKALVEWQGLRDNLSVTLVNIYEKVEAAYVAYKIDEIQGKQKFSIISTELIKEANTVLTNAEVTKSTLEEQLLFE